MTVRIHQPDTPADIELRDVLKNRNAFNMVAGAGSGKTTSLVKALDFIRQEYGRSLKVNRQRVACITYTEVATNEIFEDVGEDQLFHVSTIHSFLWELIKPFTKEIRSWLLTEINGKVDALIEHNAKPRTKDATKLKNATKITRYREQLAKIGDISKFKYQANSDISKGILGHAEVLKAGPSLIANNALLRTIVCKKYPFFFVDESQDTIEPFINALIEIRNENEDFCLGFFGDQMQNIYSTGIGEIPNDFGAILIEKPENFRCPENVLRTVNQIRLRGDGLQQELGREFPFKGSSTFFILPQDDNRAENLLEVQNWLHRDTNDAGWSVTSNQNSIKQLVIVHRIAANRLGFSSLYSALNDSSTTSIKSGFTEGNHWTIRPFLSVVLPLVEAVSNDDNYTIINTLRKSSPKLNGIEDRTEISPEILRTLKDAVLNLSERFSNGATVGDVLKYCSDNHILNLDSRLVSHVDPDSVEDADQEFMAILSDLVGNMNNDDISKQDAVLANYIEVRASEFIPYASYISENTPYETQHGIKGAEFDRVMVILDDDEGSSQRAYSYEKLLGIKPPSATDERNIDEGKDNAPARTNRLFYVACSRAKKDLAIVLFTENVDAAKELVIEASLVPADRIKTQADFL